jgi:hypothetical protein
MPIIAGRYAIVYNMKANNSPRREFWHDKKGNLVVFQPPTVLIIFWAITFTLSQFIRNEPWQSIFSWMALVALVIWGVKEALFGVNYFRRTLGAVIALLAILVRF